MNKEFRKVKLISKNVLESIAYYSGFNPLYIGITFPGGHVERGESFVDAVIREVKEETGLTISKPQLYGIKDWYDDADYRYVVLFYKTKHFTGELQSSDEGKVWWDDFENLSHLKLTTEDMSDMLRVFLEEYLSEFFYYKDREDWSYQLK